MVTTMSDAQAAVMDLQGRLGWLDVARRPRRSSEPIPGRWYAENTRESIRDETFRAWAALGALLEDQVPTTSSRPRYQLARDFADLFDPILDSTSLDQRVITWQQRHLTPSALARTALVRRHAVSTAGDTVRFPDGTTRSLSIGPSTALAKAVIEEFVPRFLRRPIVLAVTESRQRLAYHDEAMLRTIRLVADERVMPDIVVADLDGPNDRLRLVFVECVATAGPMSDARVVALKQWLVHQGLTDVGLAFGTAFLDRNDQAFHRFVGGLAWGTFAWCPSEPDNVYVLLELGHFDPQSTLDSLTR